MSEIILAIAVLGSIGGAVLNTIRGYESTDEPYSFKKFIGAIIAPMMAGIVVGQNLFAGLPADMATVSYLATGLTAVTLGFGIDTAITKAKSG